VKYCSDACRRNKLDEIDAMLEQVILDLLRDRKRTATICPSEAARVVRPDDWETLMERARRAARRLVERGLIEITQNGRAIDASKARGPIRLRARHGAGFDEQSKR